MASSPCGSGSPRRASSSSTRGSSLVNTGVGFGTGVPATTGCRRPGRGAGVVAGDDRVRRAAVEVVDLVDPRHRRDVARRRRAPGRRRWRCAAGTARAACCSRRPPARITCSTVPSRSRWSSPLSFHGAWSETYLLTSATVRIASPIACFCRCRSIRSPTDAERRLDGVEQRPGRRRRARRPAGSRRSSCAIMVAVRLTRLPQPATSSSLVRRTNSAQVKSVSWFSGPAAEMK